jgi:cytoskeletal protein RodZ
MKHFEPVVKKNASYSILFLKDDSKVVRFRLKPFWIKILALVFFVFSGASGTAGYAAHYYWKKYQTAQLERAELVEKLGENRRQLGRFVSMEKIKESTMPRSTMAGVAAMAGQDGPSDTGAENPQNGGATASQGQPTATPGTAEAGAAQTAAPPGEGTTVSPQTAGPTDAATPSASGPQATDPPATGVKEHPALVSEVQIRPSGNKTFRLVFDLSNRDQQVRLNGRITVAVSTKSGDRQEITQINRDSLRFIINNYKRVSTEFVLPGDVKTEDITRLHLTVVAEDQPSITYSFPSPTTF